MTWKEAIAKAKQPGTVYPAIGQVVIHPKHGVVFITHGSLYGVNFISNHWTFRVVSGVDELGDGKFRLYLGESFHDYGDGWPVIARLSAVVEVQA